MKIFDKILLIALFILISYVVYYLLTLFTDDIFLINVASYFFITLILFILIIP